MIGRLMIAMVFSMVGLMVVSAQSTDRLVVEGNTGSEQAITTLNPLFCSDSNCRHLTNFLFPKLLNIDPKTGWIIPADDNNGLVESVKQEGNIATYRLRDDKFWSDGAPITAYDVFFSLRILAQRNIVRTLTFEAVVPLDEHTIQFVLARTECDAISQANFPIVPAHVYDPDFAEGIDFSDSDDPVAWYEALPTLDLDAIRANPEYNNPTVTYRYRLAERRYDESIHLLAFDNSVAFSYVDVSSSDNAVDRYLRGELNLLVEPPFNRRDDLRADQHSTIHSYAGDSAYFIALNLAESDNPQSAFDEDGNPIDQGSHPILSDLVIRQAMQMALDVPAIIDAVLEGDGVQLASSLPPTALGFNPDLVPVTRDVMGARQMLSDDGWRDMDGDGWRECLTCTTTEHGVQLTIVLVYTESTNNSAIVTMVQQQLNDIGIEVILQPQSNLGVLFDREFDAVLLDEVTFDLGIVTIRDFFRQSQDDVNDGSNFSSYANPEVDRLLDEADHTPNCDVDTRRKLYQEVEAILQADYAYLWLFSPNRMIVTHETSNIPAVEWETFLP